MWTIRASLRRAITVCAVTFLGCGTVKDTTPDAHDNTATATATASTDQPDVIHLVWTAVTGATHYQVSRSEAMTGPFAMVSDGAAMSYDDGSLGHSDVKYYKVVACTDTGCGADSNIAKGFTIPGAVTLMDCSRGTGAGTVTCTWAAAVGEVDGTLTYRVFAHAASAAPTMVGMSTGTSVASTVTAGDLLRMSVAISNSETGLGPQSNELVGYAEGIAIVFTETDPVDVARASRLKQALETDISSQQGVAGSMPVLHAVLVPANLVSSTFSVANTWTGRPVVFTHGFTAYNDQGKLRNLVSSTHGVMAMGAGLHAFDTVTSAGGAWGIGGLPNLVGWGPSASGASLNVRTWTSEGNVFTSPLYATAFGVNPGNTTVEQAYTAGGTYEALYAPNPVVGVTRLCQADPASAVAYYPCAQQGRWAEFGFEDIPDAIPGKILVINYVYRMSQL